MIQSTINDSSYYDSEGNYAERNPNSNPKVANHTSDRKKRKVTDTDTTNRNSPRKLFIKRLIPEIIHCQTYHRTNLICRRIEITVNRLKRKLIRRKSVVNTRNKTRQTHRQAILIRPTTMTTDASDVKRRAIRNHIL